MPQSPVLKFNGMANTFELEALPPGKAANAVNVMFSDTGNVLFPRWGSTLLYEGDIHSVYDTDNGTFFVEDGDLKLFDKANPATPVIILASVGSDRMFYTRPIGFRTYFSNGTVTGKYTKGDSATTQWGIPVPAAPTCTPTGTGGMLTGYYRVVITWISIDGDESAAGPSTRVTVADGGGIQLTNLPSPPAFVDALAVYLSPVNDEKLYLYNEYVIETQTIDLVAGDYNILLETQFFDPPAPPSGANIVSHYGRIYWWDGPRLCFTEPQRYGLTEPESYLTFDSTGRTIVSCPGVLYVGTDTMQYKMLDVDGETGIPIAEPLQDCGSCAHSEVYHQDGVAAYYMSDRGLLKVMPEGLSEVTYDTVAMPLFPSGDATILYKDGLEYLIFIGKDGIQNDLATDTYNAEEWVYGSPIDSAWAINLKTKAVSQYADYDFNTISGHYGGSSSGFFSLYGDDDSGVPINGFLETGKFDFTLKKDPVSYLKRIPSCYVRVNGGKMKLQTRTDNTRQYIYYEVRHTHKMETVRLSPMAQGATGGFWQFKLSNVNGSKAVVSDIQPLVEKLSRRA